MTILRSLIALIILAISSSSAMAADRPNVILIMADDMGFSDIGCYGGEISTPNLDQLASNGLRYTHFYNGARCCPTRAALLTGLYAHQAGMGGMEPDHGIPGYRGNINRQCVTIAEALRRGGYGTYMSGKWHLTNKRTAKTPEDRDNWPNQRGFDHFYGTIAGAGSFFLPATLTRDNEDAFAEAQDDPNYYYTDAISENASKYIKGHTTNSAEKPFFLYVAYTAPHWPMHAPEHVVQKYLGKYRGGWDELRKNRWSRIAELGFPVDSWKLTERTPFIPAWNDLAADGIPKELAQVPGIDSPDKVREVMDRRMAIYAAMVEQMDTGIGRIVNTLKETGQFENTLVLFLADNGGCAEYGICGFTHGEEKALEFQGTAKSFVSYGAGWANASNTPFRFFKHDTYEGGISTPLIAHWPAGINAKEEFRHQTAHIIDVMPTVLDVAKVDYPVEFDGNEITPLEGISLTGTFTDKPLSRGEPLFWEHHGNRAVRDGKWKAVANGEFRDWELYDISKDRSETQNLAEEFPAIVKKMDKQWWAWAKRANVLPMNPGRKNLAEIKKTAKPMGEIKFITLADGQKAPKSGNGAASQIVVENKLKIAVRLWWVNLAGEPVAYGEIAPGESRSQGTYHNHTWLITDTKDKPIGYFVTDSVPRFVRLKPEKEAKK